eukprot:jgi/Ulvmu1/12097/UM084_0022.1
MCILLPQACKGPSVSRPQADLLYSADILQDAQLSISQTAIQSYERKCPGDLMRLSRLVGCMAEALCHGSHTRVWYVVLGIAVTSCSCRMAAQSVHIKCLSLWDIHTWSHVHENTKHYCKVAFS